MPANPDAGTPEVSVVLPVFNEITHLDLEIKRIRTALDAAGMSYEIIVVDDGSTDGSAERLRGYEDIRLVQYTPTAARDSPGVPGRRWPAATSSCGPTST